ncbi:hypothetical protein PENTCL1PPCAC_6080, partial [Pristionchus entomophagus]
GGREEGEGMEEAEEERQNRRIQTEFNGKMEGIDRRLRFIQISLQPTGLDGRDLAAPAATIVNRAIELAARPDLLRIRSVQSQIEECQRETAEVVGEIGWLLSTGYHDLETAERVLQRVQEALETIDRLHVRCHEINEHLIASTENIHPTPLERRRRKSM